MLICCALLLCIISSAFCAQPTCDPVGGSLRSQSFTANTIPGSNVYFEFDHFRSEVAFVSFQTNGTCKGTWHTDGVQPVVFYVRNDGIPWYYNSEEYDYELTLWSSVSEELPTPGQWGGAIFGYDGSCNVQITLQVCECNPGYLGLNCASNSTVKNWGDTSALESTWTYYCIPQGAPNIPESYTIKFGTSANTALILSTRWGAVPDLSTYDSQDYILPGQYSFNRTILYPQYVVRGMNETNSTHTPCYWVGVYNPSADKAIFNLSYVTKDCISDTGGNCSIANTPVGQSVSATSTSTWTYFTFDPSQLINTAVLEFAFAFNASSPDLVLYTRREGPPTLDIHDYTGSRNRSSANLLLIYHPQFAMDHNTMWWAGVYNPTGTTQTFSVSSSAAYCDRCNSSTGRCVLNASSYPYCACNSGFAGRDCSQGVTSLSVNAAPSAASINRYGTNYHAFKVPLHRAGTQIYITVQQSSNVQFLLLNDFVPSAYNYVFKSSATTFTAVISSDNLVTGASWYITAQETLGTNASYSISIIVAGSPFATTTTSASGSATTTTLTSGSATTTLTTSTSTTGRSYYTTTITSSTSSTTGTGQDVVIRYKLDGGAAAGIAISMLAVGLLIGLGAAYMLARRRFAGYQALRGNSNFD